MRVFAGGGMGSLGCTARDRIAAFMRCKTGENESSIGKRASTRSLLVVSDVFPSCRYFYGGLPILVSVHQLHTVHIFVHGINKVVVWKISVLRYYFSGYGNYLVERWETICSNIFGEWQLDL